MTSASDAGSFGSKRSPVSPSTTVSASAPRRDARTGRPANAASADTSENDFERQGGNHQRRHLAETLDHLLLRQVAEKDGALAQLRLVGRRRKRAGKLARPGDGKFRRDAAASQHADGGDGNIDALQGHVPPREQEARRRRFGKRPNGEQRAFGDAVLDDAKPLARCRQRLRDAAGEKPGRDDDGVGGFDDPPRQRRDAWPEHAMEQRDDRLTRCDRLQVKEGARGGKVDMHDFGLESCGRRLPISRAATR